MFLMKMLSWYLIEWKWSYMLSLFLSVIVGEFFYPCGGFYIILIMLIMVLKYTVYYIYMFNV